MSSTPNMTKKEREFIAMGQFREGQWMENYGEEISRVREEFKLN